uniref:Uncharacterized protein n=1 Tax=Rhizophora mucronata TaxID=61149 RepID=A0A2P2QPC6_RHIMU
MAFKFWRVPTLAHRGLWGGGGETYAQGRVSTLPCPLNPFPNLITDITLVSLTKNIRN